MQGSEGGMKRSTAAQEYPPQFCHAICEAFLGEQKAPSQLERAAVLDTWIFWGSETAMLGADLVAWLYFAGV